ncbi:protein phosphatase [Planobispora rosea]|uniref:Protein phosphatase n=1 Tax=Planobispora rosea TaxID=35762 RepID=A0A8J3S7N6_PLARO|nr:protein phosphatase 2C domain-containing protein [Planobispora rosea]GGS85059.1 protein phosphatase [Planobispora rosea]GIH86469.1 protein phosphatase [Planobispora rosea]
MTDASVRAFAELSAAELPPRTLRDTRVLPMATVSYASHVGLRRRSNNDYATVETGKRSTALVVADGVGASQDAYDAAVLAAEVAAHTAARTGLADLACTTAQHVLAGQIQGDPWRNGYGTSTLTVVALGNDASSEAAMWVEVAWLGDSSVWQLLHSGELQRVTSPHNPPGDLHCVLRHVLKGEPETVTLHLDERPVRRLLVCSDGLDGDVDHEVIANILTGAATTEQARDTLVDAALAAGGHDNITVIVADLDPSTGPATHLPDQEDDALVLAAG